MAKAPPPPPPPPLPSSPPPSPRAVQVQVHGRDVPGELERQAMDGHPAYKNMGRAEASVWEWEWEEGRTGRAITTPMDGH